MYLSRHFFRSKVEPLYVWLKFLSRARAYLNVTAKTSIKKWTKEPI